MTCAPSTSKLVSTLIYVYPGAEYFTGRTAEIKLLNDTLEIKFTKTTFTDVLRERLLSYTASSPLSQEELDHISLVNGDMLQNKVVPVMVKVYVHRGVIVRQSLGKGNKFKWQNRFIHD